MPDEQPQGGGGGDEALRRIRVVLVQPQGAANVGAVARAMKNLGLRDLALVGTSMRRVAAAKTTAVHAADLLDRAQRNKSVAEAVADCNLVVGTSAQGGLYRDAPETPAEVTPDILGVAQRGKVAIVFGPEHHGLTRDDLRWCQRLIRIDTAAEYSSLNLAQAVLLVCYELRRQLPTTDLAAVARTAAAGADVQRLEERMRRALLEVGFLNPQNPDRMMFVLRRMLGRAVIRPFEARVLLALAGQLEWCGRAAEAARRAGIAVPGPARDRGTRGSRGDGGNDGGDGAD